MQTLPKTPVVVKPGRTVYPGGSVHAYNAGETVHLPSDHAEQLAGEGHVETPAAAPAA